MFVRSLRLAFALAGAMLAGLVPSAALGAPHATALASAGWNGGPGGQLAVTFHDFAEGMPLAVRMGVGYSGTEPGDPWAARRVFINANTNGTPQSNGRRWDYRLDAVWRAPWRAWNGVDLVAGPRLSRFSGQYDFIGGNEFFNVVSTQWGLGAGAEASFPMSSRADFVAGLGLDYFLSAKMTGHDTSYSPDGTAVNAIDDYGWADADAAVHQPKWSPRLMVGVQRRLGR